MSNTTIAPQGRATSLYDRVNAQSAKANQPMQCECGSTFFYTVRAEEFTNSGFGTAQLRALSMNTQAFHICLCGKPVALKDNSVGKTSEGERARFLNSVTAAVVSTDDRYTGGVSKEEHQQALNTIEELKSEVAWLTEAVATINQALNSDEDQGDEITPELTCQHQENEGDDCDVCHPPSAGTAEIAGAAKEATTTAVMEVATEQAPTEAAAAIPKPTAPRTGRFSKRNS